MKHAGQLLKQPFLRGLPEVAKGKMVRNPTNGELLTKADLPSGNARWTIGRKMIVVAAVKGELVTREEIRERYHLSEEELVHWEETIDKHGPSGLRVTHIQDYR